MHLFIRSTLKYGLCYITIFKISFKRYLLSKPKVNECVFGSKTEVGFNLDVIGQLWGGIVYELTRKVHYVRGIAALRSKLFLLGLKLNPANN